MINSWHPGDDGADEDGMFCGGTDGAESCSGPCFSASTSDPVASPIPAIAATAFLDLGFSMFIQTIKVRWPPYVNPITEYLGRDSRDFSAEMQYD